MGKPQGESETLKLAVWHVDSMRLMRSPVLLISLKQNEVSVNQSDYLPTVLPHVLVEIECSKTSLCSSTLSFT